MSANIKQTQASRPRPLIDSLSPDAGALRNSSSVQLCCALLDNVRADGRGRIDPGEVKEMAKSAGIALGDLQLTINALRAAGAMNLVLSLDEKLHPHEPVVMEPGSNEVVAMGLLQRLPTSVIAEIGVDYRFLPDATPGAAADPQAPYETTVISNGHPGPGKDEPFDVAALATLISHHQLADLNRIEDEGHGTYRFIGNFVDLSHVFQIRSNDPAVVVLLIAAMDASRRRPDYVSDCEFREAAAREYHAALQATGNDEAYREARKESAASRVHRAGEIQRGAHRTLAQRNADWADDARRSWAAITPAAPGDVVRPKAKL